MEKNNEKAAYFAQYLFSAKIEYIDPIGDVEDGVLCAVARVLFPGKDYFASVYWNGSKLDNKIQDVNLLLTPLSDITDEDKKAIEYIEEVPDNENDGAFIEWGNSYGTLTYRNSGFQRFLLIESYQYLQSKGYALPFRNYSVEQLIEMGWLKLKLK